MKTRNAIEWIVCASMCVLSVISSPMLYAMEGDDGNKGIAPYTTSKHGEKKFNLSKIHKVVDDELANNNLKEFRTINYLKSKMIELELDRAGLGGAKGVQAARVCCSKQLDSLCRYTDVMEVFAQNHFKHALKKAYSTGDGTHLSQITRTMKSIKDGLPLPLDGIEIGDMRADKVYEAFMTVQKAYELKLRPYMPTHGSKKS
jgi:hypothetical protein